MIAFSHPAAGRPDAIYHVPSRPDCICPRCRRPLRIAVQEYASAGEPSQSRVVFECDRLDCHGWRSMQWLA